MSDPLPVPPPNSADGGIYSIGYNAWSGQDGLSKMFDALEAEGVTIVVDTRNSDFRARHSFDQLAGAARNHQGQDGKPMRYAHRPVLTGKPKEPWEYNDAGQADYAEMDKRPEATEALDGMAAAARKGERIALLCACKGTHTCHRTRWLAKSLEKRGVDVGHIEPGEQNYDRYTEQGERELYTVTPHSELPDLPDHSDTNWLERQAYWKERSKPKPPPDNYQSPAPGKPIPSEPTQVLIAGSMNANNAQLNYASNLVVRAAEVGAQIHVGDNDQGVDARVVQTANSLGYENVVVWTAGDDPRNGGVEGGQIRKVPHNYKEKGNRFTQRDRTMIRGLNDETGAAVFIDNGNTHYKSGRMTGTEAGYVFAVEQDKGARKVSFGRKQDREAELDPLPTEYTSRTPDEPEIAEKPVTPLPPPAPPDPPDQPKRYPTLGEFEASLRQRMGLPEPDKPPEPLVGISVQTVQTVDSDQQPLGYSSVTLRDVYANGVPIESDISESYAMELARFEKQEDAQQYSKALTQYIKQKDGLEFMGTPERTAETQAFMGKVAEGNGLEIVEEVAERDMILEQGRFDTAQNKDIQPLQLPAEQPNFDTIIDLDI